MTEKTFEISMMKLAFKNSEIITNLMLRGDAIRC